MGCDICGRLDHDFRCPQYSAPKKIHHCSYCGEDIHIGEECIENLTGEYRHYDCFHGIRELVEWLGCKVKTMEDGYE